MSQLELASTSLCRVQLIAKRAMVANDDRDDDQSGSALFASSLSISPLERPFSV